MADSSPAYKNYLAWGILILLAVVWGSSFILMKRGMFTAEGTTIFSANEVAALRIAIAFLAILPFAIKFRSVLFSKKWKPILVVGLFGNGLPAFLFTAAQKELDSSYVGMLNSLVPLFTLLIAILFFKTKIKLTNAVGVLIGLGGALGLVLFQGIDTSGDLLISTLMVVAATLCYGLSVNVIKNYLQDINPIAITAIAFTFIGPPTIGYLFATSFSQTLVEHPEGLSALGYISILAVIGTALAVILFNRLVSMTTPIFASSVTYMIPIIAIFWGILDEEAFSMWQGVWIGVILGGVWLINRK